jgi:hypothetical protein
MKVKTVPDVFGASSFFSGFAFSTGASRYGFPQPATLQLHFARPKKPHSPFAAFAIGDYIPGPVDEVHEEKHSRAFLVIAGALAQVITSPERVGFWH